MRSTALAVVEPQPNSIKLPVFDPSLSNSVRDLFNTHVRYSETKPPKHLEPELKIKITGERTRFNDIWENVPVYDPAQGTQFDVVRVDNNILYKDYVLISADLDTVDAKGMPVEAIRRSGHQLRMRFGVDPALLSVHGYDHKDSMRLGETCVKSLQSMLNGRIRIEVEDQDGLSERYQDNVLKSITQGPTDFLRVRADVLPAEFPKISARDLRVKSLCATTRASSFYMVYLPEDDVMLAYEATYDEMQFATPNGDIAGRQREFEIEAKNIFLPLEKAATCTDEEKVRILKSGENKLRRFFLKDKERFPYLSEFEKSKMERANSAVNRFYKNHGAHGQEMLSHFGGVFKDAANQNLARRSRGDLGIRLALMHGVTLEKLISQPAIIAKLAGELPAARSLITAPGAIKVPFGGRPAVASTDPAATTMPEIMQTGSQAAAVAAAAASFKPVLRPR